MKNTLETRLGIFFALALVVAVIILEMIGAADFFRGGYKITGSFKNVQDLKKGELVRWPASKSAASRTSNSKAGAPGSP
jgi:ABC-type transporter Mla subunit MlaD